MEKINKLYMMQYLERLIPKLFKLMPLKENEDMNYDLYLEKLITQLLGFKKIIAFSPTILDIICNLEGIKSIDNIRVHNSIIKECISICQKSTTYIRVGLESDKDVV